MRRRLVRIALIILLFPPALAAVGGWMFAPSYLHPIRRPLSADLIRDADATFAQIGAHREDFDVRASDGALLHGWKVRAANSNTNWVLLYHGVADNRFGVLEHARVLLLAGYNVVMMDMRAHGASEGSMATYGWLERTDTRATVDALLISESARYQSVQMSRVRPPGTEPPLVNHIFALGESMGAGIALQSAAIEPRIEGVVAEASFANLREAAYDYAGLRRYPWLGKTWLAPGTWTLLYRGEALAGFPAAEVSPEKAVAARAFPVLLICDAQDDALPCRHTQRIYAAATGPKQMWIVPGATHTAALGYQPAEFKHRILGFFAPYAGNRKLPSDQ